MNKTFFKTIAVSAAAMGAMASSSAYAQNSAEAEARADILQPITVTNTAGLNFATIITDPDAGGNVVVAADGSLTCATALACTGTASAAAFGVTGTDGRTVDVDVPETVTLSNANGDSMIVTLAASDTDLTLAGGSGSFTVGGSLAVAANQADGVYSEDFEVTVEYQ